MPASKSDAPLERPCCSAIEAKYAESSQLLISSGISVQGKQRVQVCITKLVCHGDGTIMVEVVKKTIKKSKLGLDAPETLRRHGRKSSKHIERLTAAFHADSHLQHKPISMADACIH